MKKPNLLAIDGDLVAYKAASVAQRTFVEVEHLKTKTKKEFKTKTEFYGHHAKKAGGWLAELNDERALQNKTPFLVEEFKITDHVIPEPPENACQIAKQMILGICKDAGIDNYVLYLSGNDNFRDNVATIYEYKGDRKDQERPVNLKVVQKYLVKRQKAIVCKGEADDQLAIESESGRAIQSTTDKDATQAVGWCFDYDKAEAPFEIKQGVGMLWVGKTPSGKDKIRGIGFKQLMWQMLAGDSVDCIFPRYLTKVSYGEKTAYKDLKPLKTEKECLEFVLKKYKQWYPEPVTYTHWNGKEELTKDYFEIASEIFLLLYMHRVENDTTTLESLCNKLGVDYAN